MDIPMNWGVYYTTDIEHAENSWCDYCRTRLWGRGMYERIVGFTKDAPPTKTDADRCGGIIGAFIIECSCCHREFYLHAAADLVAKARHRCPNWPKGV